MTWFTNLHIRSNPASQPQQPVPPIPPRPEPKPFSSENHTLFQSFEWHTKSWPPRTHETHAQNSHYARLSRLVPRLADLGITTIWLPPGCKANTVGSNGYDCYDLWDLGEFDQKNSRATKWGSREELAHLLAVMKRAGVEACWDAVLNHKTAGDSTEECWAVEVDGEDRRVEISEPRKIEAWLRYEFHGRKGKYSQLRWDAECFSGTDWDQRTQKNAIYKIISDPATYPKPIPRSSAGAGATSLSRFARGLKPPPPVRPGKNWAQDVDDLHGNYDFLMFSNICYGSSSVRADTEAWGDWMVKSTGVQGFRLDAVQHISYNYIRDWISHVQRTSIAHTGKSALMVGEIWTNEVHRITSWLDVVGQGAKCFDSPLLYNFSRISTDVTTGSRNADLRTLTRDSLLALRPEAAITVVSNHDTQPGQASYTPMNTELKMLWYAFILLREESLPCVFWGDLYGTCGPLAEEPACLDAQGRSLLPYLMMARKMFAYGQQAEYFAEASVVGWTRAGTHEKDGCAVVLAIGSKKMVHMVNMRCGRPGEKWVDLLYGQEVVIDEEGCGKFGSLGWRAAVYVREGARGKEKFPVQWDLDIYEGC